MQFITKIAALAIAATLASANSLTFINQDETTRTIIFTPTAGQPSVDSITIEGNDQAKVDIPTGWIGNAYAVAEGAEDVPGMLAEVTFQGWNDLTYFDVSAIVNANDKDGVKQMYPATQLKTIIKEAVSGCLVFPCNTAYYQPDEIQTVTTKETDLIVTLGNTASDLSARDASPALVARHYVLGKLSA